MTGTGRIYVGTGTSENRLYAIRDDRQRRHCPLELSHRREPGDNETGRRHDGSSGSSISAPMTVSSARSTPAVRSPPLGSPFPPADRSSPLRPFPRAVNTVYFGSNNGDFYCPTCTRRPAFRGGSHRIGDAFQSSPDCRSRDGTIVYVGNDDGKLYAFNDSTGAESPVFSDRCRRAVLASAQQ